MYIDYKLPKSELKSKALYGTKANQKQNVYSLLFIHCMEILTLKYIPVTRIHNYAPYCFENAILSYNTTDTVCVITEFHNTHMILIV